MAEDRAAATGLTSGPSAGAGVGFRPGVQLHGVIVGADSLSGIPFFKPLECDSCRVSVRLGAVDSLRIGDSMDGFWRTVALGAVAALVVLCRLGWCEAGGT